MAATIAVVYPHMNGFGGDGFWLVREPRGPHPCPRCLGAGRVARHHPALPGQGIRRHPAARARCGAHGRRGRERLGPGAGARPGARRADAPRSPARRCHPLRPRGLCRSLRSEGRNPRLARRPPCYAAPGFAEAFLVEGKRRRPARCDGASSSPIPSTSSPMRAWPISTAAMWGARSPPIWSGSSSPVTRKDLETYRARVVQPLSVRLRHSTVYNLPPPSQGLASLLILGMFERLERGARRDAGAPPRADRGRQARLRHPRPGGRPIPREPDPRPGRLPDALPALEREAP